MKIRNYVPIQFIAIDKLERPERHLEATKSILDRLGLDWCFAFGTALGLYRDKGFIPQDTDIDVMILADGVNVLDVAQEFLSGLTLIRTVMHDSKYHQIAFQAEDGMIIDLCFFYKENDHYVSFCEGGHWKDPVETIGSFIEVETEYGCLPVPEKIEDYLVDRYGDWKIPIHGLQACSIKEVV